MKKTWKSALSLILALCVLAPLAGLAVYAEDEPAQVADPAPAAAPALGAAPAAAAAAPALGASGGSDNNLYVSASGAGVTATIGGTDLAESGKGTVTPGDPPSVTVNTGVSASGNSTPAVQVTAWSDNSVKVTVEGDAVATGTGTSNGVEFAMNFGAVDVTIEGDVSAPSYGIIDGYNMGGTDNITVGSENNKSNVTGGTGIYINNANPASSADIKVYGDVTGTSGKGISVDNKGTTLTVTVSGDVTGGADGVQAKKSTITVGGNVTGGDDGVEATDSTVTVGSDVTGSRDGVYAYNSKVTVGGDVSGSSDSTTKNGVDAINGSEVKVTGSVTGVNGDGVYVYNSKVTVGEDVTAAYTGVTTENSTITVDGDVTGSQEFGIIVRNGSNVTVGDKDPSLYGKEDLSTVSGSDGIGLGSVGDGVDVMIDGILKVSGGTPIILATAVNDAANINITLWQIEGANSEEIVTSPNGKTDVAQAVQESINYIIKIKDDKDSRDVFGGSYTAGQTTKSGEQTIQLKVPSGCTLVSAFATDGNEVPITFRDGAYYAVIPVTGGIYLNAKLQRPVTPGQPASDFTFSVTPVYSGGAYTPTAGATVIFDLNGGNTVTGNPGPIVKQGSWDTWFVLPEAPSREGSSFARWECDDPDITVTAPGSSFCPWRAGTFTFTAVWAEEA